MTDSNLTTVFQERNSALSKLILAKVTKVPLEQQLQTLALLVPEIDKKNAQIEEYLKSKFGPDAAAKMAAIYRAEVSLLLELLQAFQTQDDKKILPVLRTVRKQLQKNAQQAPTPELTQGITNYEDNLLNQISDLLAQKKSYGEIMTDSNASATKLAALTHSALAKPAASNALWNMYHPVNIASSNASKNSHASSSSSSPNSTTTSSAPSNSGFFSSIWQKGESLLSPVNSSVSSAPTASSTSAPTSSSSNSAGTSLANNAFYQYITKQIADDKISNSSSGSPSPSSSAPPQSSNWKTHLFWLFLFAIALAILYHLFFSDSKKKKAKKAAAAKQDSTDQLGDSTYPFDFGE